MVKSRQWVLTSRPDHKMTEEHFQLKEADLGEVPNGGALFSARILACRLFLQCYFSSLWRPYNTGVAVRMLYLSVDPTQRIWSSPVKQYMPNQPLNDAFRALGAGIVEKSRNSNFNEGDYVLGALCWQTHYVSSDGSELTKLDPELPIEAQMSALGMVGETAWMCLKDYVKKDDVVLISAALGGVGSIGGQLAKLLGAKKVVGIVGSESKVERAKKEFGYDVCINRNNESDIEAAIARESPEGVDVYLDNVGPPILDAAIANMNLFGRIPICGMISSYEQFSSDKTRGNVKVRPTLS